MVLGLKSKNRKGTLVQVDYLIHIQGIKPWPPSQSLKSAESVLLQWENGNQNSGSFTSNVGDGKIEFNENFRLPVMLYRETTRNGTSCDSLLKKHLELSLYELRKDGAMKGKLLGSAVINLADYGNIKDSITISSQIKFKKSSKSTVQPVLYGSIQPVDRYNSSLSKEVTADKDVSEGNDKENEIASFTDDDIDDNVSSHSSRAVSSFAFESSKCSPAQAEKNIPGSVNKDTRRANVEPTLSLGVRPSNPEVNSMAEAFKYLNGASSTPSSSSLSSKLQNHENDIGAKVVLTHNYTQLDKDSNHVGLRVYQTNQEADRKGCNDDKCGLEMAKTSNVHVGLVEDKPKKEQEDNGQNEGLKNHALEVEQFVGMLPQEAMKKQANLRSNTLASSGRSNGVQGNTRRDKLKHLKSVQLQSNAAENDESFNKIQFRKKAEKIVHENFQKGGLNSIPSEKKKKEIDVAGEPKVDASFALSDREQRESSFSGFKVELESEVEILKEELMEAAVLEHGIYSVVAEHGSSTNKVHAPARHLFRFYLHAWKASSRAKRASAARAIISGLVLTSKACGSDVPRLTFWLSNSIVLRAIVSQVVEKLEIAAAPSINTNGSQKGRQEASPLKDEETDKSKSSDEWEKHQTFVVALERVEAWIFSRIVESVWWQTLTPHMQPSAMKGLNSKKTHARRSGLGDKEHENFAIDLWKKAFQDAFERLCPIRAGGHECGCLPVLARLIMEQLVRRLDVGMFNAILRESADEMPTDPISDPISDPMVLPIPVGKSTFGAGAQLKNAVGNWSRWLTDLFGIDDNDSLEDLNKHDSNKIECDTSLKAFHLLNTLSDLMMLPFEMLADRSARKEVCPIFGTRIIKRVLNNFVPDEFNPDPIPEAVFKSLDSEELTEDGEESVTIFPCTAAPASYSPPPAASLTKIIGEVKKQTMQRTGSAVLKKSYTSDDELDEFDSPLNSIIIDNSRIRAPTASNCMPKSNGGRKVVRYQLLRQLWNDGE